MTDALIAICTDPAAALARRAEIREALARTLQKKQIRPLGRWFAWTLALEGPEGWLKRAHMLGQLMSNTQHLGLVVRGDYLHLSRSAAAVVGTLGSLYKDVPRHRVLSSTCSLPSTVFRRARCRTRSAAGRRRLPTCWASARAPAGKPPPSGKKAAVDA